MKTRVSLRYSVSYCGAELSWFFDNQISKDEKYMQMIKQQASEKKTVFPTTTDQICDGHGQYFDIVIFF